MNRHSSGNERSLIVNHPNVTQRRRTTGSTKLSHLFGKETSDSDRISSLLTGLEDLSVVSKLTAKTAEAQRRGCDQLARWAHKSRNAAIDDVMQQSNQIFHMFADKQLQFARDYEHFVHQLRKIVETEKLVKECEVDVKILSEKERKIKKELTKGGGLFSKKKNSDLIMLRDQLDRLLTEKELAERRLEATRAEAEVIKMFRFRHGMMGIADSYKNLAANCQAMFNCQREITEMVPAVSTQDVNHMFYEGIPYTRERVDNLRRSLDEEVPIVYNPPSARRMEHQRRIHSTSDMMHSPPPPYTPTAPPQSLQSDFEDSVMIRRIVSETPRTRHISRQAPLRRPTETSPQGYDLPPSSFSSPSSSDESTTPSPQRLYPRLDEPDSVMCPLKEFGINNRPAYGVH